MEQKNIYQKFISVEPYFHPFLWSMVLFYPYIKHGTGYIFPFSHELTALVFKLSISYFLYLWFFPKKDKKKYVPIVVFVFLVNGLLYEYVDHYFHPNETLFWKYFVGNLLTYINFGIVFFTIHVAKDVYKKQVEMDRLILEKKQAEVNALKARVNPHFLFNTLNTIYANALRRDDETPNLILKLSDGFRYLLHEGQKDRVHIRQEIQHLRDYIDLQQERLSEKVSVEFLVNIKDQDLLVAPLLLTSFVENAFKYTSILKGYGHKIKIEIVNDNDTISFFCSNPYISNFEHNVDTEWQESGIGIRNTEERLKLIYPDAHELVIDQSNGYFIVKLKIHL